MAEKIFRIWTNHFVPTGGSNFKGLSFIERGETIEQAVSKVMPKFPEGAKIMGWTDLTTGEQS